MKKLLNTVYITIEGASLRKDGENLVAEVEGVERARVPFHMLASVVVFGGIFISPALIAATAGAGITLVLLDRNGRFLARVEGPVTGNVLLRGSEGEAANLNFSVFDHLIRSPDPKMRWTGRSCRPPLDPVNALLSFLYTLLTHDCRSAMESVGLDPAVGFLHRDRPGRPSLALDLMEKLRPVLADRLALSLINRRQLRAGDFETRDGGAVMMSDDARRTVLTAWQERKKEERLHPFLEEKAPLRLAPFLQAQMLARHLRGDLDAYPPWLWK